MKQAATREHQNVYGQKIGVKYFVDKRLKPRRLYFAGEIRDCYPLYLRITAKRETTNLKSALDRYIPEAYLDDFLRDNQQDIADEVRILREQILAAKPFDNEHFKIKYALEGFSVAEKDVVPIIGDYLLMEYGPAFSEDLVERRREHYKKWTSKNVQYYMENDPEQLLIYLEVEVPYAPNYLINIDESGRLPLHLRERQSRIVFGEFFAHALPQNKAVFAIYEDYKPMLFELPRICQQVRAALKRSLITLDTFLSVEFDSAFLSSYGSKEQLADLREGFKKLTENHPDLLRMVRNRKS